MAFKISMLPPKWLDHISGVFQNSIVSDNEPIYRDALASRGAAAAANAVGRREYTGSKTTNVPVDKLDWRAMQAYYGETEATIETTTPEPQTIDTATSSNSELLKTSWTIIKATFVGSLVLAALLAVVVFFYHTNIIYQGQLDEEKEKRRKQSTCLPKYADWSDEKVSELLEVLSETVEDDDYIDDDQIESELDDLVQELGGRQTLAKGLKTSYFRVFFETLFSGFLTFLSSPTYPFRVINHYVSNGFGIDAWTLDRWINASIAWIAEKPIKAIIYLVRLPFVYIIIPLLTQLFALLATLYHRLSPSEARRNAWNDRLEAIEYHPFWRVLDDRLQRLKDILAYIASFLWYLPIVIFLAGLLIPVYRDHFPAVPVDEDYQWSLPMWAEVARIKQFGFSDYATPMDWDQVVSAVKPREPLWSQENIQQVPRRTKTVSKWAPETTTVTVSVEADTVTATSIQTFTQTVVETTTATVTASKEVPALDKLGHRVMEDWGSAADGPTVREMGDDWKGYCRGCKQAHCCEHHG